MNLSDKGIRFLRQAEGVRSDVYKDSAGLPTIGVGHLLTQSELSSGKIIIDGEPVKYGEGLSNHHIDELLKQDVDRFEKAIAEYVKVPLYQNQFDALVSFSFNVGVGAFKNSTLLKVLNARDYDKVPEQLKRWVYSSRKKVQGLVNRRNSEIALWRENVSDEPFVKLTAGKLGKISHHEAPDGSQTIILTGGWRIS